MKENVDTTAKISLAAVFALVGLSGIFLGYAGGLTAFFRLSDLDDLKGHSIHFGYETAFGSNSNRDCIYLAREANKVNFERNRDYISYKASIYFYDPFVDEQYEVLYDDFLAVLRHAINLDRNGSDVIGQTVFKWCSEGRRIAIKEMYGG